jgi:hypothetical protein
VVEQASPEVVYVPSYNPVDVYGPAVYPYPPIYYPPYTGVVAASAISFGVGVAMGAAWGGGWGWGAGWGNNDIDINVDNNFNRNSNFNNNANRGGRSTWQHNPQHRGGAPYADRATANRFGSNARGDSLASRQKGARQEITRQKGDLGSVRDRAAGGAGVGDRGGLSNRPNVDRGSFSGGDRIGSRNIGSDSFGRSGGFGGGSGGFQGGSSRSSSMRGHSSMGGGGARRSGGGGFGGGGGGRSRGGGRR